MTETRAEGLPAPPEKNARVMRLGLVGLIVAGVAGSFAAAAGWLSPHALTPSRIVDAFERANGSHPGFRRNHAKGVGVTGYFESNGSGAALSKAEVFKGGRVPVIGRFALPGGMPFVADTAASVRSLAVQFNLPNGEQWRTGMNDIPVFPVNTPEAFYEQLVASAPDPATHKPDPQKMSVFLAQNPSAAKALQLLKARPKTSGFESSTYNSLNAFRFTNEAGTTTFVRWALVPKDVASGPEPANTGPNYLFDDLIARVRTAPLTWSLVVTIAAAEDAPSDATIPWPAERQHVDVGTLTIDHVESEETSAARDINFDPLVLPAGIEPSDDPLLSARSAAYSESFRRRTSERKEPSAITSAEAAK